MPASRNAVIAAFSVAVAFSPAGAQVAIPFSDAEPVQRLDASLRSAIEGEARGYALVGFKFFGRDSVQLVFEDSSITGAAMRAGKWMFGPPVTPAEAEGCPPEKVLGRRIARALWRSLGKPEDIQYITVAVRGTTGIERWSAMNMYFHRVQLEGPWVGDPGRK